MFSLEKWLILTRLLYLPQNGENWGKLIVAKGFKELPKVQKIARSGHTAPTLEAIVVSPILLDPAPPP